MTIKQLLESKTNKHVNFFGFLKTKRLSKNIAFLSIKDGSCQESIQVVVLKDNIFFNDIGNINIGSSLKIIGDLLLTPSKPQPMEIKATKIKILSASSDDYPIQNKEHSFEFLREIAHIRTKTEYFESVFRIRSLLAYAVHSFFQENNYIYLNSPILTQNDAEGGGEAFSISNQEFFGKNTSLSVSGQLSAEAFAMSFKKVYTFGPTFRAEKSNTTRHLSEFWMIEPEVHFMDIEGIMEESVKMIKYIFKYISDKAKSELKFLSKKNDIDLNKRIKDVIDSKLNIIEYSKAIEILQSNKDKFINKDIFFGLDLETEHEKFLCENIYKGMLIIKNYPKNFKAFYMKLNDDNKTVASFDLLVPGIGELIGGSQREDNMDIILKRIKELKIPYESLSWYIDLRKYGYYMSSGFGMGFERLVMYITGVKNIKDAIPFPVSYGSINF